MSSKISDLQGIRGLAIIAVLGFHFCPILVPNGYLGVDQFFVLSGFLMCMLLTKSENMPVFSMLSNFYTRRLKRILPLYQLIIFLSLVFLYFCFPDTSIEFNQTTAERALLFMSNRVKTGSEDYFEMLTNAVDIFTHTWSLSVEIQFYLIVPFIFLLPYKLVSFSIISIISIVYHYSIPSNIAFLNMSTRIWQFLTGMTAFIARQKMQNTYRPLVNDDCEKQEVNNTPNTAPTYRFETFMLTYIMFIAVFYPKPFSEEISRPIITCFTGLLLIITSGESSFLSNRLLTYIGDISYSLYLIHWSIYSYWKVAQEDNYDLLMFYLMISIFVSILIYHTFEQWYTRLSNIQVLILVVILSLSNLAILNHSYLTSAKDESMTSNGLNMTTDEISNLTIDDVMRINKEWDTHDREHAYQKTCIYESEKPYGWCNHTGLNPSNKYKIMLIGNSWVANHAGMIYEECKGKANTMIQGSFEACEPLAPTTNSKGCKVYFEQFEKRVMEFKPDYAFHITKHIQYGDGKISDFNHDKIYQKMLNQTRKLAKYIKKKLFILDALPWIYNKKLKNIGTFMKQNKSLVELDKSLTNFNKYDVARKRYAQLFKDCGSKCERIDFHDLFYRNDTNTYRFYDEKGFNYVSFYSHLTPYGLDRVRHIFRDICDKM